MLTRGCCCYEGGLRPPLQGGFRELVPDPAALIGRNSRMLSGQGWWPPLIADCPSGFRCLPGGPCHSQSTDGLSVGKEGTKLAGMTATFPVGDLHLRAPTYRWVRKRVTTHLRDECFGTVVWHQLPYIPGLYRQTVL